MMTLQLNNSYQPECTVPWRRAARLVLLQKAELLASYDKTWNGKDKIPAVIRLVKSYKRKKRAIRFSRYNVYLRDNKTCQYCGQKPGENHINLEHIVPRSRGGKTTWTNIVVSCIDCNSKKGARTPEEAGMKLLRKPEQPKRLRDTGFRRPRQDKSTPVEWKDWIDEAYWNAELEE